MNINGSVVRAAMILVVLCTAFGCEDYPKDPEQTYLEIQKRGEIWAGVSENPPWVTVENDVPGGIEVRLIQGLADEMGVKVHWEIDAEAELVEGLKSGELDIAAAGFDMKSPWKDVGKSRPYITYQKKRHIIFVRRGENRWLMHVDRFLENRSVPIHRHLERQNLESANAKSR